LAFCCVNNKNYVDPKSSQIMCCIFCYKNPILIPKFPETQVRKGLILYNIRNGIITLKKHVCTNHFILGKKFDKDMNNLIREKQETQLTKKRPNIFGSPLGMHSLKHVNMLQ
jgi:hypothetical protein